MFFRTLLPAAAAILLAHHSWALSNADIISVFPGASLTAQSGLQGASIILPSFTLTVITNTTHALFNLNATTTKLTGIGWMGVGTGTAMVDSDFIVSWPNAVAFPPPKDLPPAWTMSHRQSPNGESEPQSIDDTPTFFTILPHLTTALSAPDSYTTVSFIRLLTMPAAYMTSSNYRTLNRGKQNFIFASSTVPPTSQYSNATLTQHNQAHYAISLDLSTPVSLATVVTPTSSSNTTGDAGSSVAGSGVATTSASTARTSRDMILIAHAIFGSLALLLLTPIAIMIPRYFRHRHWFPLHAGLQVASFIFVIISFGLAVKGVDLSYQSHFFDSHTRLGLAIFIFMIAQVALGAGAHRTRRADPAVAVNSKLPSLASKSPVRYLHMASGVGIVILGWIQIQTGFDEWHEYSDSTTDVPTAVKAIYWILVALWTGLYVLGWAKEYFMKTKPVADQAGVLDQEKNKTQSD